MNRKLKDRLLAPLYEPSTGISDGRKRRRPPRPEDAPGLATLAERLRSERSRCFAGRVAQIELFEQLLDDPKCTILFVSGQVGVGKTALLERLQASALARGHEARFMDVGVLAKRHEAHQPLAWILEEGRPLAARAVLLIDGFERLGEVESWFLQEFLPKLPSDVLVVLASRAGPPTAISLDPAWVRLMRRIELGPLDQADAACLLELLGVPTSTHASIQTLAAGYPLALAVAAECVRRSLHRTFDLEALQEAQHVLGRLLCPQQLSSEQQFALDVSSIARITTAELIDHLRVTLKQPTVLDERSAFDWLSAQSLVDSTPSGLVPHTLMRVAAHARFRRERPRRYRLMTRAIREFFVTELETGSNAQSDYLNVIFLDREVPFVPQWTPMIVTVTPQPLRWANVGDHAAILELIREQEGPESAELARKSLLAELGRFEVTGTPRLERLTHSLRLGPEAAMECLHEDDPVRAIVRRALAQRPLTSNEEIVIFRWWTDREYQQTPSPGVLPIMARQTQTILRSKHDVRSFCVYRNPREWHELFSNAHLPWQVVGTYCLDGHEFTVIEFDWKRRSIRDLLLSSWDLAERRFRPWVGLGEGASEASASSRALTLDELRITVSDRVTQLSRTFKLTPREAEILEQLCLGESPEAIGRRLSIRPRTVKFHQENLLRKTGVSSRAELFRKLL